MFNFLKNMFESVHQHEYGKWEIIRIIPLLTYDKLTQKRTCQTCGYTQIKTIVSE